MMVFEDVQPALDERCTRSAVPRGVHEAPLAFATSPLPAGRGATHDGRLIPLLRNMARRRDPLFLLGQAAGLRHLIAVNRPPPAATLEKARALAQLAASGQAAAAAFRAAGLTDERVRQEASRQIGETVSAAAVNAAMTDAFTAEWTIRGPVAARLSLPRNAGSDGWIALSGEDDPPDFPVNVPAASFPQFRANIAVPGFAPFQTRFTIADIGAPSDAPVDVQTAIRERRFPAVPRPSFPDRARIILFIHGLGSMAEEASELIEALKAVGPPLGYVPFVVALDMPGNGYSSGPPHDVLLPLDPNNEGQRIPRLTLSTGAPRSALVYYDKFIGEFWQFLKSINPTIRLDAVVGGSLGGNMVLRLANGRIAAATASPAVDDLRSSARTFVGWSPASVWRSFAEDSRDLLKLASVTSPRNGSLALDTEETRFKHFGDTFYHRPADALRGALEFVTHGLLSHLDLPPLPDMWYRPEWTPCKAAAIHGGIVSRAEIYSQEYRRWNSRVAFEQLLFSHVGLHAGVDRRLMLLGGQFDNFPFSKIHDATLQLAGEMQDVGPAIFLRDTGHSIHAERPLLLATQIVSFIRRTR